MIKIPARMMMRTVRSAPTRKGMIGLMSNRMPIMIAPTTLVIPPTVQAMALTALRCREGDMSKTIVREVARRLPSPDGCHCREALRHALITDRKRIPAATRKRLSLLIGKYL